MKMKLYLNVLQLNEKIARSLAGNGMGVEISAFSDPDLLEDPLRIDKEVTRLCSLIKEFDLPVRFHGPFYDLYPASRDPSLQRAVLSRLEQGIYLARRTGASSMVVHPHYIYPGDNEEARKRWTERCAGLLRKLIPLMDENGVDIQLENVREPRPLYLTGLVERLSHPGFGICLDTGHVHLFGIDRSQEYWLDETAPFLRAVHLNGNHGVEDEHLAFTKGGLNWGAFFSKIRELQNSFELVIEVMREEDYSESVHALSKLGITGETQTKPLEEKACEK